MKKLLYRLLTAGIILLIYGCNFSGNPTSTAQTTAAEPVETHIAETDIIETSAESDSVNPNIAIFGTFEADLNKDGIVEVYTTVATGMCTNFIDVYLKGYDPGDNKTYILQRHPKSDLRFCIHNNDLYVMENQQIFIPLLDARNKTFML